mmetsp:Transcript_15837/g.20682  ORF Transcript_15837/g.20682 Transcript_15837/m.20682 type:complete len:305 (+) Transcript_15837:82-996(+)
MLPNSLSLVTMTSLRQGIRASLKQLLDEHENEETPAELLAMVQQEARLMQETELVKDALRADPFECLKGTNVDRLYKLLQVPDCHKVYTKAGYCNISAVCQFNADVKMKTRGTNSCVELHFHYERHGEIPIDGSDAPTVAYYIDLSRDNGPCERLLWVQVYAAGQSPSNKPAVNMMDAEDGEWEDMSDDDGEKDEEDVVKLGKRIREGTITEKREEPELEMKNASDDDDQEMENPPDRFIAGIDPEVLARFLQWTALGKDMDDDLASFYFLMTFPYYEHEFHLLDYLLEAVFGAPDEEGEDQEH